MKTAEQYALKDIAEYTKQKAYEKGEEINYNMWTTIISMYFVSSSHLGTKENRRLNRELGIHKINHIKNQTNEQD